MIDSRPRRTLRRLLAALAAALAFRRPGRPVAGRDRTGAARRRRPVTVFYPRRSPPEQPFLRRALQLAGARRRTGTPTVIGDGLARFRRFPWVHADLWRACWPVPVARWRWPATAATTGGRRRARPGELGPPAGRDQPPRHRRVAADCAWPAPAAGPRGRLRHVGKATPALTPARLAGAGRNALFARHCEAHAAGLPGLRGSQYHRTQGRRARRFQARLARTVIGAGVLAATTGCATMPTARGVAVVAACPSAADFDFESSAPAARCWRWPRGDRWLRPALHAGRVLEVSAGSCEHFEAAAGSANGARTVALPAGFLKVRGGSSC